MDWGTLESEGGLGDATAFILVLQQRLKENFVQNIFI